MATVVEYAGLDPSWQHLAMFKLAQMVCFLCLLLFQKLLSCTRCILCNSLRWTLQTWSASSEPGLLAKYGRFSHFLSAVSHHHGSAGSFVNGRTHAASRATVAWNAP